LQPQKKMLKRFTAFPFLLFATVHKIYNYK